MASMTELRVKELLREKGWTTKILAEKTGLSESYLTHIKNGTRRWNEDSLRKLAIAFEISPIDLFAQRRKRTDNIDSNVSMPEKSEVDLKVQICVDDEDFQYFRSEAEEVFITLGVLLIEKFILEPLIEKIKEFFKKRKKKKKEKYVDLTLILKETKQTKTIEIQYKGPVEGLDKILESTKSI